MNFFSPFSHFAVHLRPMSIDYIPKSLKITANMKLKWKTKHDSGECFHNFENTILFSQVGAPILPWSTRAWLLAQGHGHQRTCMPQDAPDCYGPQWRPLICGPSLFKSARANSSPPSSKCCPSKKVVSGLRTLANFHPCLPNKIYTPTNLSFAVNHYKNANASLITIIMVQHDLSFNLLKQKTIV